MIEGFRRSSTRRSRMGLAAIAACVRLPRRRGDGRAGRSSAGALRRRDATGSCSRTARRRGNPHQGGSPQLVNHGGPVMTTGAAVKPIFWGSSWSGYARRQDRRASTSFYAGVGGTAYAGHEHRVHGLERAR